MDQPGKIANPVRGQLNRENAYFPCDEDIHGATATMSLTVVEKKY